jgi:hypothetical protein
METVKTRLAVAYYYDPVANGEYWVPFEVPTADASYPTLVWKAAKTAMFKMHRHAGVDCWNWK